MIDQNTQEMAKAYSHEAVEAHWYDWWESQRYFMPGRDPNKESYTIIMPPPNVTGVLHMGHALTNAVEDILIRYKRMSGYEALYLPGEDHAGISGQYSVEKELAEQEMSRHDLGRERFVEYAWGYMNRYRPKIRNQLRRLGASCDWSRERFTMDPGPRARRAHRVQAPVRQRAHLQRRTHHKLVPALRHHPLRPGGGERRGAGKPVDD